MARQQAVEGRRRGAQWILLTSLRRSRRACAASSIKARRRKSKFSFLAYLSAAATSSTCAAGVDDGRRGDRVVRLPQPGASNTSCRADRSIEKRADQPRTTLRIVSRSIQLPVTKRRPHTHPSRRKRMP